MRAAWQASEAVELNAAVRVNSDYFDSSIPTGLVRADGHGEADLGLRWKLSERFSLTAALRNLTGERYQDAVGFPAPGRLLRRRWRRDSEILPVLAGRGTARSGWRGLRDFADPSPGFAWSPPSAMGRIL